MSYVCGRKKFKTLSEATDYAELVFKTKGAVIAIEKSKAMKAAEAARINKAVVGYVIPMMSIPKLYAALELAIGAGVGDEELKKIVGGYPGVKESV